MNRTSVALQDKTASFLRPSQGMLQRKCACGNKTVAGGKCAECAKNKNSLQRKLSIGASNDPLEREADRVADQVMAMPGNSNFGSAPPRIQRFSGQSTGQGDMVPASVDSVLASSGRPMEPVLRQDMEQRFGHDFSQVQVHTGAAAEQSARDVSAHAYTAGHNIVFGAERFPPESLEGRRLLAHELTHVVQQGGGKSQIIQRHTLENDPATAPSMTCNIATKFPGVLGLDVTFNISNDILSTADKAATSHFVKNWHTTALYEPVRVYGFASIDGLPSVNWPLSCRRAETLTRELLTPSNGSQGIPARYISLFAQGETEQFSSALEPNRRAQAHIPTPPIPPTPTYVACYDGTTVFANKNGRVDHCLAVTGSVGKPTPDGEYCIREQGAAQLGWRPWRNHSDWYLLEPQFSTTRSRLNIHPGSFSSGCVTVTNNNCFSKIAGILNSSGRISRDGYDGYPPGNSDGVKNPKSSVTCVGLLIVRTGGNCSFMSRTTPPKDRA